MNKLNWAMGNASLEVRVTPSAAATRFDRSTADETGQRLNVKQRTVTNYLQRLTTGGQLQKLYHGQYQKKLSCHLTH